MKNVSTVCSNIWSVFVNMRSIASSLHLSALDSAVRVLNYTKAFKWRYISNERWTNPNMQNDF